ncbi:hypothetical protein [Pseudomonas aeruginosa]|uniref:hypothetical protein n=1 Tax=Pseudomonas aeruginosa TaxID=287 RepID=UPI0009869561|nr:hypothetical protein [Pseudomonas aeruginosa]OOH26417.1 hypothetical protein B0B32_05690 [Pseudomonas aeruginosa]OOH43593.1 hypothetical protein B0B31_11740 [Pseudomonas aeruginosa]HBP5074956.1 hypothetical protein [Pseudomonas aeruginosa]
MSEVKRFDVPSMRSLTQGEQAVMGYEVVLASDYDALAAEAQALREEVAEYEALCNRQAELLSQSIVAIRGPEPELTRWGYADLPLRVKTIVEEAAALRARVVVVPDAANDRRKSAHYCRGWNACLDELARLNDMTVSEGLVQGMAKFAREIICGALDGGSFDGADIQESAERHGLIAKQVMNEPCRGPEEYCACAWSTSFPAECYRVTPKLRALLNEDKENSNG